MSLNPYVKKGPSCSKLVGKFLVSVHLESGNFMKILKKVRIQDLLWNREPKSFRKTFKPFQKH